MLAADSAEFDYLVRGPCCVDSVSGTCGVHTHAHLPQHTSCAPFPNTPCVSGASHVS